MTYFQASFEQGIHAPLRREVWQASSLGAELDARFVSPGPAVRGHPPIAPGEPRFRSFCGEGVGR